MVVKIKNQRGIYVTKVHRIYTKETTTGLITSFLVNDKKNKFHWVDFEQCELIDENKIEFVELCYSCVRRIIGCNFIFPANRLCSCFKNECKEDEWKEI